MGVTVSNKCTVPHGGVRVTWGEKLREREREMGDARMDIIVQNSVKVAARVELLADPLRPEPAFAGLAGLAVGDGGIVVALQTHRHAQTGHAIGL